MHAPGHESLARGVRHPSPADPSANRGNKDLTKYAIRWSCEVDIDEQVTEELEASTMMEGDSETCFQAAGALGNGGIGGFSARGPALACSAAVLARAVVEPNA